LKYPRLFTLSLRKIKSVVGFLRYELGLEYENMKRVLFCSPQILGLHPQYNIKTKMDFLRGSLDLTTEELEKLVTCMPTLFQLSIEKNMKPKLEYLKNCFQDEGKLKQVLIAFPVLLGYSFEKRLQPRMQRLLDIGENPGKIVTAIVLTEKKFDEWIQDRTIAMEYKRRIMEEKRKEDEMNYIAKRKARIVKWTR